MNKKRSYKKVNSLDTFFLYLRRKMSSKENNAFERQLLNDPFEADALDGFEQFTEDEIKHDLSALSKQLNSQTKNKHSFLNRNTIALAATLLFVAGIVSVLLLFSPNKTTLVSDNTHPITKEEQGPQADIKADKNEMLNKTKAPGPTPERISEAIEMEEEVELVLLDDEDTSSEIIPQVKSNKATFKSPEVQSAPKLASRRKKVDTSTERNELVGTIKGETVYSVYASNNETLRIVQGKVKNAYQEPVAGASINVKGTSHKTIANADGAYKLTYPSRDSSNPLTASYIGYKSSEISANSTDSVIFTLEEEYIALSEVITIETDIEALKKAEEYVSADPIVGMDKYIEELSEDLNYPKKGSGKRETVIVSVHISPLGYIKDIIIKRSPGELYSMEAIRVIQESSGWKAATNLGLPVQDEVKIRLRFIPPDK